MLRNGKWDIPAYLGDGAMLNIHLAYFMMRLPFGVPYTLDEAYPFVQDATVVFGFPDIIFQPEDDFDRLLTRQAKTNADVVLGLFPVDRPKKKWDMVKLDSDVRIQEIIIKPIYSELRYTWIIAVWTPLFSHFMHEYLPKNIGQDEDIDSFFMQRELYMSHVLQHAIDCDFYAEGVLFPAGNCLDIGTLDDLEKAIFASISHKTDPNRPTKCIR